MKKYAILSLMAVLALGACDDDDDPTGNPQTAQVRIVNATTATTGTNTYTTASLFRVNDQIGSAVPAGVNTSTLNASACSPTLTVPAGSQTLHFRATASGTQVASVTHNFVAGRKYLVVLMGNNNAGLQTKVFEETQTNAPANTRRVRFINASSGAAVDVFATATAATAPGTATTTNIASAAISNYFDVANTNNAFRFYTTGGTTTNRTNLTLNTTGFPASNNATIIMTENSAFQVNACS
jgi:hypothetical protein